MACNWVQQAYRITMIGETRCPIFRHKGKINNLLVIQGSHAVSQIVMTAMRFRLRPHVRLGNWHMGGNLLKTNNAGDLFYEILFYAEIKPVGWRDYRKQTFLKRKFKTQAGKYICHFCFWNG